MNTGTLATVVVKPKDIKSITNLISSMKTLNRSNDTKAF
jgi:hypothetical protein